MADRFRDDAVVVAIDQGTSSTKALVVDLAGTVIDSALVDVGQSHPSPGWVEQDAHEILQSVRTTLERMGDAYGDRIAAVGLSNQRESAVLWDRRTGSALAPVISWQDRRTSEDLRLLAGHSDWVRAASGLPLDPMFSALKIGWLLDQVDPDRSLSRAGEIAVGTVDSWLLFHLTGEHRIEIGNASRTQLLNIRTGRWDERLRDLFNVPEVALPRIVPSDEPSQPVTGIRGLPSTVRIHAVLGDSHAALFAHGARTPGPVKVTYGTGSSVMGLAAIGGDRWDSTALVETIAWSRGAQIARAFEGNVLSTGATIVWLARILDCDVNEVDRLARTVDDAGAVSIVPAFAGIGAPWWNPDAKAVLVGLDLGTTSAHLARAAFDSIVLQIEDVVKAAEEVTGTPITSLLADGGPARNDWLMQLQADTSERDLFRPGNAALSGLGVAHLAGLAAGVWTEDDLARIRPRHTVFVPDPSGRRLDRERWLDAVGRSFGPLTAGAPTERPRTSGTPSLT